MALRAGEPHGPVGIETLTQSPELLTNAKAAAQNDRQLRFFGHFFCAASEEKSFCMQSHTLVDPCVKNCYPKEIIIILHVVLHDSVHTM